MKVIKKITVVTLLSSAILFTACTPPPPPVSKNQLSVAEQEAKDAEARVASLQREKGQLEAEKNAKQAKIEALKDMAKEMN